MRAQRPQRPSLDTSFSSLSLETSKASGSAHKPQRDRADSAASHSSSSAFATPPEGHSPRHSLIPATTSTSSAATATQEGFGGPFKSDDTINLTHSPRSLHTRTASVGSPPLHEFVKAKYDYVPDHPSGLPFYAGQLIQVHYKDASGWWDGEVANVRGWFPSNYLFQNSSKFVRASSQSSRRLATHRSRNASIDVVTPADRQNAQARPVVPQDATITKNTTTNSTVGSSSTTSHVPLRQNVGGVGPYSYAAERRRPSLATTDEQDEHVNEETTPATTQARRGDNDFSWNRQHPSISRSASGQSIANSYFQSSSQGHAQHHSRSQSVLAGRSPYYGTSSVAYHSQPSTSTSPTPQQQQQDWASLSISDLVALQTLLVRPSPLSALRHPDPATPFEAELARQFSAISSSSGHSSKGDSAGSRSRSGSDVGTGGKPDGALFLHVVHCSLWVLENAVVATADTEDGSRRASLVISEAGSDSGPLAPRDYLAPAMACVIGTVRSVLSSTDCLPRESETLRRYPGLVGHRKVVLGELARLVSQIRRVGNRGCDDEPLSPIMDEMSRRGSDSTQSLNRRGSVSSTSLGPVMITILDATTDLEVRRGLERSQAVYDGVCRFIIAAVECSLHFDEPPIGIQELFGLVEDEREPDGGSEASIVTGEGSWEEDHGFRFRVASGSINGNGIHSRVQSVIGADIQSTSEADKYAIRARRFADTRPGHSRRRTGSNASGNSISMSGSGYGSPSAGSGGSRNSAGSTIARIRSAAPDGIEQRLQQVSFGTSPSSRLNVNGGGSARRGTDATNPGADTRAASAVAAAAAMRAAKSLGDLRARYLKNGVGETNGAANTPVSASGSARLRLGSQLDPELKAAHRAKVIHGRSGDPIYDEEYRPRATKSSISSISSAESSSSNVSSSPSHSSSPPSSPGLPSGPCTVIQVLQALRTTQDRILHGTAAFIGAAQYHSRSSHPASKSYLVSLTREIVDFVRRLLIIADAILGNSAVRSGRAREVELAGVYKARLYVEMNRVVDAVRELTSIRSEDSDGGSSAYHGDPDADEEEKGAVLKRAHLANKCSGELVLALKLCLSFRVTSAAAVAGDRGLLIVIPPEVALSARVSNDSMATGQFSPSHSTKSISRTPNDTPKQTAVAPSPERTPKPRLQYGRLNTNVEESRISPLVPNSRARAHTTRDSYSERTEGSLHKKAVSMMGMNAIYRAQAASQRRPGLGKAPVEDDEHLIEPDKLQAGGNLADFMELDEERDEESDRERYPLLMSEQEFSDGQDEETHDELEDRMTVDYSSHKRLPSHESSMVQSRSRRSIEQVRRSLERGLTRRPSMNLLEPTTPLDGTEEVVEIDEESEESEEPRSSGSDKALPQPPVSPLPGHPPRPAHAPPPKPANHDGLVVSNNGNIVFNSEGVVVGATLQALVDRITPADAFGDTKLASYFLLTFRLFASPVELVDAIVHRFKNPIDCGPSKDENAPIQSAASLSLSETQKSHMADRVHLRVLNFMKEWTKGHWYPARDIEALPKLQAFCMELAAGGNLKVVPTAKRMLQTFEELSAGDNGTGKGDVARMRSAGRLREQQANLPTTLSPTTPVSSNPFTDIPRSEVNKSLLSQLKNRQYLAVSILDFSPVEMARQLTLLESRLYCEVPPEEAIEIGMHGKKTPHVKALSTLSTTITGWVTDWILKEGFDLKKRIAVVKFFLKVGKECLSLCNYSTPRSMMAALESTPISRLKSMWAALSQKHRLVFQEMHDLSDHSRNSAKYRQRLRNTVAPAVPFLGLILTDVTFTREGNGAHRPSPIDPSKTLINFNRYNRLAKIMGDMIRLQQPYNLKEIAEVQQYLNYVLDPARITADADVLHRRSRLIEPRVEEESKPGKGTDLFGWANFGSIRGNPGGAP